MKKVTDLEPWECLMKQMVWRQLGDIQGKKILDFGSGIGVTANYLAEYNDVIAIEPDEGSVEKRWVDNQYTQIVGSTEELCKFDDESFDMIICHNVLEYVEDRVDIVKEFVRILKYDGRISIVKHNRAGRVMQMVVLLNDFEHAHSLLDGNDGMTSKYGAIRYYDDEDIEKWCRELKITKTLGIRTFWDMQQNQENHKETDWQEKMVEIEMRVSDIDKYREIAFFHHLMLEKKKAIFKSTLNTRPIFGNDFRYIRSDVPTQISDDEKEWLVENGITTIVDLRTDEERTKKECPLSKDNRFQYYCMPVSGGNAIPKSVDDVSKSYIDMVDEKLDNFIDFMLNNKSNILYFCNAGKDRTGVISAILLWKSGMNIEYIVEDYMKSKLNLKDMLESFAQQNRDVDINIITPHERYIREFLKWLEKRN